MWKRLAVDSGGETALCSWSLVENKQEGPKNPGDWLIQIAVCLWAIAACIWYYWQYSAVISLPLKQILHKIWR